MMPDNPSGHSNQNFQESLLFLEEGRSETSPSPTLCRCCTVHCRQNVKSVDHRLLSVVISVVFAFSIVLMIWNIVLWQHITILQSHVAVLAGTLQSRDSVPSTDSQNDVTESSNDDVGENYDINDFFSKFKTPTNDETNNTEKIGTSEIWEYGNTVLLKRVRRTIMTSDTAVVPRFAAKNSQTLSRTKRSGRKQGTEEKKKRKKGRKERGKGRRPRIQKAVAIHVQAMSNSGIYQGMVVSVDVTGPIITDWRPSYNYGFYDREIADDGGVKVLKTGVYFIYSQVVFKMSKGTEITVKITTGVLGNEELSACTNSFPPDHDEDDYITCYASGVTHMQAGDRFRVKISPPQIKVFMSPSQTYFGAFHIGA